VKKAMLDTSSIEDENSLNLLAQKEEKKTSKELLN
jgi:hypothetical protein